MPHLSGRILCFTFAAVTQFGQASAATCSHPAVADELSFWLGREGPLSVASPALTALRARLGWASLRLVMQNAAAPGRGSLLDIGDVTSVFHAAFVVGGARGLLDLLEMIPFKVACERELARIGLADADHALGLAPKAQSGITYSPAFLEKRGYPLPNSSTAPAAAWPYTVQGGLWRIRHWAGEYLAAQARAHTIDAATVVWWTQQQQKCRGADFATVGVEHAVVWYEVATAKLISGQDFPSLATARWCHRYFTGEAEWVKTVRTDLGRECRHAVGHGVFYWLAFSKSTHPEVAHGYASLQHTLRTVGPDALQLTTTEMELGIRVCSNASNRFLASDCINGLFHSYDLISPRPNASLKPASAIGTAFLRNHRLGAVPVELSQLVGKAPQVRWATSRNLPESLTGNYSRYSLLAACDPTLEICHGAEEFDEDEDV